MTNQIFNVYISINDSNSIQTYIKLSQVFTSKDAGSPNEPDPTTATFTKFDRSTLFL